MDISEDRKADAVVLALSGKFDATTAKTFQDKILAEIDSGDRRFVIDLSQLDYVSNSGLRIFLLAAKRLQITDGKIVPVFHERSHPPGVRLGRLLVHSFHLRHP